MIAARVVCAGCGAVADHELPFRCDAMQEGDDADHLLQRELPAVHGERLAWDVTTEQPFLRYRQRSYARAAALAGGLSDEQFVDIVRHLDARVALVDGAGFTRTAVVRLPAVAKRLGLTGTGQVFAKLDATAVAGSHKARHLFGIMLTLLVRERLDGGGARPTLAIASCGNAALAAAVVARAALWPLQVFVPPDAEPAILERLASLGADVQLCPRQPDEIGDPCVLRFRAAVENGALPFCCQGNDNGLTIEGGETLAYELVEQVVGQKGESGQGLDRVLVQVGGGALMSAIVQGLQHAVHIGALPALPRLHAVQTRGGFPLARAWTRAAVTIEQALVAAGETPPAATAPPTARASWLQRHAEHPAALAVRQRMRTHRSEFMWPWQPPPHSVAHGILDDETYDWRVLVEAMLTTGGFPVIVDDEIILEARELARVATGVAVSATGAAGLAGLLTLAGTVAPDERVAVVLSGRDG